MDIAIGRLTGYRISLAWTGKMRRRGNAEKRKAWSLSLDMIASQPCPLRNRRVRSAITCISCLNNGAAIRHPFLRRDAQEYTTFEFAYAIIITETDRLSFILVSGYSNKEAAWVNVMRATMSRNSTPSRCNRP